MNEKVQDYLSDVDKLHRDVNAKARFICENLSGIDMYDAQKIVWAGKFEYICKSNGLKYAQN
jgi:hypothetical protein